MPATDYFNDTMVNRQRLLWTVATRRQLERWEPIVATVVLGSFAGPNDRISARCRRSGQRRVTTMS